MNDNGTRQASGRSGQEGSSQEAQGQVKSEWDVCQICDSSRGTHGERRHTFTPHGVDVDTSQFKRNEPKLDVGGDDTSNVQQMPTQRVSSSPIDGVLRMALINKGILTVEDLTEAERMVKMVTDEMDKAIKEASHYGL